MKGIIRADAGLTQGSGHVMRTLALAQEIVARGGEAHYLSRELPTPLKERLEEEGIGVLEKVPDRDPLRDAGTTRDCARELDADWVIVDGYEFDGPFLDTLARGPVPSLLFDDIGRSGGYPVDLILNGSPLARESLYESRKALTEVLLGPRYLPLRREFNDPGGPELDPAADGSCRVLVTMGGVDPPDVTTVVLDALEGTEDRGISCRVLMGPANPRREAIRDRIRTMGPHVECVEAGRDMPELMRWADLAFAAGGSTCWELARTGVPMILVVLADNQEGVVASLVDAGAATAVGHLETLTPAKVRESILRLAGDRSRRETMGLAARCLVDGGGAARVVDHMTGRTLRFRDVRGEDCRRVWEWANDPGVRAFSFATDPIPWEDHQRWFAARREDPGCRFWIVEDAGSKPVGQVRFQGGDAGVVTMSVSIDAAVRGRGLGSRVIDRGVRRLFDRTEVGLVEAYIKTGNGASVRSFEKAGFVLAGETVVKDSPTLILTRSRT